MKTQTSAPTELFKGSGGRIRLTVILGALAMLLILLSELWPKPAEPEKPAEADKTDAAAAYQERLEKRLAELITQVDGAGQTVVMVTLETGEETVYALDTLSGQTQNQKTHVLLDDGTALEETIYLPKVCGVAVICDGGGDIRVAARITELVGALLDIPSNHICVEQRSWQWTAENY